MKYQMLFWSLIATSLSVGLFGKHQSQARPAPIFQSIIEEIRTRIPSDYQMRLPAYIPDGNLNLISIGEENHEVFAVLVSETHDCA